MRAKISKIDDGTVRMQSEIKDLETRITTLTAEKEASMGGEVKSLTEKVDLLFEDLIRETAVLDNKEDTLKGERKMLTRFLAYNLKHDLY